MSAATGKPAPTPHTPEPWRVGDPVDSQDMLVYVPIFAGKSYISSVSTYGHKQNGETAHPIRNGHKRHISGDEMLANARRIVACVNACAGASTEWLESNRPIVLLGPPITERFQALERQRDALEAVLRKVAKLYPDDPGTSDLDNEQPVPMTLGLLREVWAALSQVDRGSKS